MAQNRINLPTPSEYAAAVASGVGLANIKSQMVAYVEGLVLESFDRLRIDYRGAWDRWQRNMELTLYGRAYQQVTGKWVVRKIQGAVLSNAAIQTATPPKVKILERTTGAPSVWYFNSAAAPPDLVQGMNPPGVEDQPLTTQQVQALQLLIQESKEQSAVTGLPPAIPAEVLVRVDDATLRSALQVALDTKFEASGGLRFLRENILYNGVFGHQFLLSGWDDEERRWKFKNIEPVCAHVDLNHTSVDEMEHFVWDEFLGIGEALQLYPELTDAINKNASSGRPMLAGGTPYVLPAYWQRMIFYRPVVVIRHTWIRYQRFPLSPADAVATGNAAYAPMTEEEALLAGHVSSQEVPDDSPTGTRNPGAVPAVGDVPPGDRGPDVAGEDGGMGEPHAAGDAAAGQDQQTGAGGEGSIDEEPGEAAASDRGESADLGDAGESPGGDGVGAPAPRTALIHNATGQEIHPGHALWPDSDRVIHPETMEPMDLTHKDWPTRAGIWEIKIIAGEMVAAKECERTNIPVLHNVNIPIMFTPFGQGEPERLEQPQDAYNRVVSDIVSGGEYAANPASYTTKQVIKDNPAMVAGAHAYPGRVWTVDERWMAPNMEPIKTLAPPPTPPDQWRRETMLDRIFTDVSDQASVLRGEAPAGASGVQVEALQSAGATNITFKSQTFETSACYFFQVLIGDILLRMTPEQLAEDFPKYSVYIWREMHRRLVKHFLFSTISVELASGGAAARQSRATLLTNAKTAGVPVSDPEILESMELDPDEQLQRQADFERKRAVEMPQPAVTVQGPNMPPMHPPQAHTQVQPNRAR